MFSFVLFLQSLARHQELYQWIVLIAVALLVPEAEVGIVAPGRPGDVELVEHSQHVAIPVVGQFTIHGLIHSPLPTEQLQVVLLGGLDGILELLTDLVDVPYLLGVWLQFRLDGVRCSIVVFLRHKHTRIVHLALVGSTQW